MVLTINGKPFTRVQPALAEIQRTVGGLTVGIVPRPGGTFTFHKAAMDTPVGIVFTQEDDALKIDSLTEGGIAAGSGLQVGDKVQTINGKHITSIGRMGSTSLMNAALDELEMCPAGDVTIGIVPRAGASTRTEPVQTRLPPPGV